MIVKLYLPDDWSEEMYRCWLDWLTDAIMEAKTCTVKDCNGSLMLRHVEKIEKADD